jgi:hypothetical protein
MRLQVGQEVNYRRRRVRIVEIVESTRGQIESVRITTVSARAGKWRVSSNWISTPEGIKELLGAKA